MKNILITIILLAILLAGCSHSTDTTTNTTSMESINTPAELTTAPISQEIPILNPMVTVSLPGSLEEFTSDDGSVIFRYFRQRMQLIVPDQEVADKIIDDFRNRIDQSATVAEEIHQQAITAYQNQTLQSPFLCNVTHAPMRIDQTVLSLYGNHITYSGGAHPSYSCCAANYNMLTGEVLTLGSILAGPESKAQLCQLVIDQLAEQQEAQYIWPSYPDTVTQRFATEESFDESWYFSDRGICFYFAPYEIAAYASGVIIAEVPYGKLTGIIDDAFFPPESDRSTGSLTVIAADDNDLDLSQFTRFSELIIDPDAPACVVFTDGVVTNVQIYAMNKADQKPYTAYAAQAIGAQDAIIIEALPDVLKDMYITFRSGGEDVVLPLKALSN